MPITLPVAPGEHWLEQGGTYAGIMRGDDGTLYHLIVSPDAIEAEDMTWGKYGKDIAGADSKWDGAANTAAMVKAKNSLAKAFHGFEHFGHADWYVPAQRELSLCWATVPHLFQKAWYWSSTQYSPYYAWVQGFEVGSQYINYKDGPLRARAVRRLIIQ